MRIKHYRCMKRWQRLSRDVSVKLQMKVSAACVGADGGAGISRRLEAGGLTSMTQTFLEAVQNRIYAEIQYVSVGRFADGR